MRKVKLLTLVSLFGMSILLPNVSGSSEENVFEDSSMAVKLSGEIKNNEKDEGEAWLGAAAAAITLAYYGGYVLGTAAHHVYHAMDGHPTQTIAYMDYDKNDFSKFDN